jgi:predicted CoA-binding protein
MKITKEQIKTFFEPRKLAIAGVSRSEKKFGNLVFKEFQKKNYEVIPINPNVDQIEGKKCYHSVSDLPEGIDSLLIITPKSDTDEILRQAINKGIKNIWVQQSCETESTVKIAKECDKEIIFGKCVYMFAEPVEGFHKFHRTIMKIFGQVPN